MKKAASILALVLLWAAPAQSHLLTRSDETKQLKTRERSQETNLAHAAGTTRLCERLKEHNAECRWHRRAVIWLSRELNQTRAAMASRARAVSSSIGYWISRQISAAERIAEVSGGDPWPNCPDPYDGSGASWYDTVRCENSGSWMDSPGYYRCGIQADPAWERRFGYLFCPV
jgi:hypothetical protein